MHVMEHRCAGKLSGGFGGPFMYVLPPTSTKPKYRLIKMEKKKEKKKKEKCKSRNDVSFHYTTIKHLKGR